MSQMKRRTVLKGTGAALPRTRVSNVELSQTIDTTDAWIFERTGIRYRHIAEPDETSASLGAEAGRKAIAASGINPKDIDLIIVATVTPNSLVPSNANRVQAMLGMGKCIAFDITAACSGFLYAMSIVDAMMKVGQTNHALIIGTETLSRMTDWTDRATCILFGDGAGAMVLSAENTATDSIKDRGILASILHADGQYKDVLYFDGGPSTTGTNGHIRMIGSEVFRHAVTKLSEGLDEVLDIVGMSYADIDWLIPHQANHRIINACTRKTGIDPARVVISLDQYANTSAASIPIAFDTAVRDGRIKSGDLCAMQAIGGGLTWAATIMRV